jgi:hypothetical protein
MSQNLNTSTVLMAPELQSGMVLKRSKRGLWWNRRWLSLRGRTLYLANHARAHPKRSYLLDDLQLMDGHRGKPHSFTLRASMHPQETMYFAAFSGTSKDAWISVFAPRLPIPALSVVPAGLVRTPTSQAPSLANQGPYALARARLVSGDALTLAKMSGEFVKASTKAVRAAVDGLKS